MTALEVIRCLVMNIDFKTNARSNYIYKFEVSDRFQQVVSSGMFSSYFFQVIFPLMMQFIVQRNLASSKTEELNFFTHIARFLSLCNIETMLSKITYQKTFHLIFFI